jgi:ketosteroid isomerase-like protein
MKRRLLIAMACLAPAILAADGPVDNSDVREIQELEAQFGRAVIAGDRAYYDRVLAEDFTHTSHSGVFKTRAEFMAENKFDEKKDPKSGRTRYDAYDVDDLAIRIYGDTAVVTGRTSPKGRTAQGQPITGQYRYLRVWVKRQGRWQAVAFQGTRITQP